MPQKTKLLYNRQELSPNTGFLQHTLPAIQNLGQWDCVDLSNSNDPLEALLEFLSKSEQLIIAFNHPTWRFFAQLAQKAFNLNLLYWDNTQQFPESVREHFNLLLKRDNTSTSPRPPKAQLSKLSSWLQKHVLDVHIHGDWWDHPTDFIPLIHGTAQTSLEWRRLAFTFLKSYELEEETSSIKGLLRLFRDQLIIEYAKALLFTWPSAQWLTHFATCYFRFPDWLSACEEAVSAAYEAHSDYRGGFSSIAVGILQGVIENYYHTQPTNPLIVAASRYFDKDIQLRRVNWNLLSRKAIIHLIKGDDNSAWELMKKVYENEPGYHDGFSHLGDFYYNNQQYRKAITCFKHDFEHQRQSPVHLVEYLLCHVAQDEREAMREIIESAYANYSDLTALGLQVAKRLFHPHWFDIASHDKRAKIQTLAGQCLALLDLDTEFGRETEDSFKYEGYWKLYFEDFNGVISTLDRMQLKLGSTGGYASHIAYALWTMNEVERANAMVVYEKSQEITCPEKLHLCAVIETLLSESERARASFARLHELAPQFFAQKCDSQRWFYQALAMLAIGEMALFDRFKAYAENWDSLYKASHFLLERVKPARPIHLPDFVLPNVPIV